MQGVSPGCEMLPLLGGMESSFGLCFASSVSPWVNLLWILVLYANTSTKKE
jgi:hypothetical protein